MTVAKTGEPSTGADSGIINSTEAAWVAFAVGIFLGAMYFVSISNGESKEEEGEEQGERDVLSVPRATVGDRQMRSESYYMADTSSSLQGKVGLAGVGGRERSGVDDIQSKLNKMTDGEIVEVLRRRILRVDDNAVRSVVFEPGTVSETVNKRIVRICVRDARGRVFPINTLVHVALHELAHTVMTEYDFDHSERFQAVFAPILQRAVDLKVYDPEEGVVDSYVPMCTRQR